MSGLFDQIKSVIDCPRHRQAIADSGHCCVSGGLPVWGMHSVALSDQTRQRLKTVFPVELQEDAEALLVQECGANLPLQEGASPEDLERIRFAALKLSKGTVDGLCEAIQVAQDDWRDLLVAADFAEDVNAHKSWLP